MKKNKSHGESIQTVIKVGTALLLTGAILVGSAGCSLQEPELPDEDTQSIVYSIQDQTALKTIPYQVKGIKQKYSEGNNSIGKEKELEKKYVFDIRDYYGYETASNQAQVLFLLGHNEAYSSDLTPKEIWIDLTDPEKELMSTAYLKSEFTGILPERYESYFNYIGNPYIFDVSVDYQVLKDEESNNYYMLKTYSLTLKNQPSGIVPRWPVGETFKYTVFAKINLGYNHCFVLEGYDVIAEKFEGIGSDEAVYRQGSVNLDDVLHPVQQEKPLTLSKTKKEV